MTSMQNIIILQHLLQVFQMNPTLFVQGTFFFFGLSRLDKGPQIGGGGGDEVEELP